MVYRRVMEQQLVPFGFYHLLGTIFCIGLDVGVTIAVAVLLYYQVGLSPFSGRLSKRRLIA